MKVAEKLIKYGVKQLTDNELLNVIAQTDIAELVSKDDDILEFSKKDFQELCKIKGIGKNRAASLLAAVELSKRQRIAETKDKIKITSSKTAFELFNYHLSGKDYEQFWILLLNRANKVIKMLQISDGGISGTVADPKRIFIEALKYKASSLILCHNHPSGSLQPSEADNKLTNKLKEAGKMLDIDILDHLIIGQGEYYSYADNGNLN